MSSYGHAMKWPHPPKRKSPPPPPQSSFSREHEQTFGKWSPNTLNSVAQDSTFCKVHDAELTFIFLSGSCVWSCVWPEICNWLLTIYIALQLKTIASEKETYLAQRVCFVPSRTRVWWQIATMPWHVWTTKFGAKRKCRLTYDGFVSESTI